MEQMQNPDFVSMEEYKDKLFKTFNTQHEIKDIEYELDLLLGSSLSEELIVYPDQHIEGI